MSIVFAIWYVCAVAGTGLIFMFSVFLFYFLMSSGKTGLVVTKSLSICLSVKDFIFLSHVKISLAGCEILG